MSRENEFTVPSQANWNRMVLHDDLLCGGKCLPERVGGHILNDIAVGMKQHLNIPALLPYMMTKSFLTDNEVWQLQERHLPPGDRFFRLRTILQGKGADSGLLVFYLCLMESYGPEAGLRGHYVLSQMIRRKVRFHCKVPPEQYQQDTEWIVSQIKPIPLSHDQAQQLRQRLQLPGISSAKPPTLDVICNNWLATHKGGDWTILVEVLLTERGLGFSVSGVLPPSSSNHPDIWDYVRELCENWEYFAEYLGFPRSLIIRIQNEWSLDIPTQLQKFMQVCLIPNCKERMSAIVTCIKQYVPISHHARTCHTRDMDPGMDIAVQTKVPFGYLVQLVKQGLQDQPTSTEHNRDGASALSGDTDIMAAELTDAPSHDSELTSSSTTCDESPQHPFQEEVSNRHCSTSGVISDQELGIEVLQACINEKWELATTYITAKCDLEAKINNGKRALHICCMKGKEYMVELLVQHGADVSAKDNDGNCCLHYRETLKQRSLVELFIQLFKDRDLSTDQANKNGFTPLAIACQTGDICYNSALLLVTNNAQLNGAHEARCTPLIYASGSGSVRLVELLLTFCADSDAQDRDGNTALIQACLCNHLDIARMLLENGANIHKADKKGSTALAAAVSKNSYEMVQTLLIYKANVNATRYITSEFTMGQVEETPLASACARGFQPIAELLIEKGAKINHMCSDQVPPIGFAIICRQRDIVKYLLQLPGFSKSAYGLATPLHIAISVENYDAAKLLLDAIGGPYKALEVAERENHASFAQEIQIYMAMVGEDILSAPPEHFSGTSSVSMEGQNRAKVEEVLQKFSQISMLAVSKRDLDNLVEIASALDEPHVACFFREYCEGKLLRLDVLKSRFLSRDSGTPPATFTIQHGLLDKVQFCIHALEVYPEGPEKFYENLVWAFHQINGGEDLPWDIDSVLGRLFSGQFSLGVQTVGVADAMRDSMQGCPAQVPSTCPFPPSLEPQGAVCAPSQGSSQTQRTIFQPPAANEGRRLGRGLSVQNTFPVLGSEGMNTSTEAISASSMAQRHAPSLTEDVAGALESQTPSTLLDNHPSKEHAPPQHQPPQPEVGVSPQQPPPQPEVGASPQEPPLQPEVGASPQHTPLQPEVGVSPQQPPPQPEVGASPQEPPPQQEVGVSPQHTPLQREVGASPQEPPLQPEVGASPQHTTVLEMSLPTQTSTPNPQLTAARGHRKGTPSAHKDPHIGREKGSHHYSSKLTNTRKAVSFDDGTKPPLKPSGAMRKCHFPNPKDYRRTQSSPGRSLLKSTKPSAKTGHHEADPDKRKTSFNDSVSHSSKQERAPGTKQGACVLLNGVGPNTNSDFASLRRSASSQSGESHTLPIPIPKKTIRNPMKMFRILSPRIIKWAMLARYLYLQDQDIDSIKKNYFSSRERCEQMLHSWHKRFKEHATYFTLAEALIDTMQGQLLDEYRPLFTDDD